MQQQMQRLQAMYSPTNPMSQQLHPTGLANPVNPLSTMSTAGQATALNAFNPMAGLVQNPMQTGLPNQMHAMQAGFAPGLVGQAYGANYLQGMGAAQGLMPQPPRARPQLGKKSRLGKMQTDLLAAFPPPRRSPGALKKPGDVRQVHWGANSLSQYPMMPKGLQFVNTPELVEFSDFQALEAKLRRDMEYSFHQRLEEYDEIQKEEGIKMLQVAEDYVTAAKAELRVDIRRVIDVDLADLDTLT